jgi:FKBP-type peptidyl-prolyl cis-trans isomerase FkpA
MTEVTRVPLQPIAKGSLAKLWIGIAIAVLVAAGLAWAAQPKGLKLEVIEEGMGPTAEIGQVVFARYTGRLPDGTTFDESQDFPIPASILPGGTPFAVEEGATIPGFFEGLQQVKKGGKYTLHIPAEKAYGDEPPPGSPIPAGSDLVFDLEVVDILERADVEQRFQAAQQFMMAQQAQQGAGEAAPPE